MTTEVEPEQGKAVRETRLLYPGMGLLFVAITCCFLIWVWPPT